MGIYDWLATSVAAPETSELFGSVSTLIGAAVPVMLCLVAILAVTRMADIRLPRKRLRHLTHVPGTELGLCYRAQDLRLLRKHRNGPRAA